MPFAFEWSKFMGVLCIRVASIYPDQSNLTLNDKLNIAIIKGLLNRSSRLLYSMIYLGSNNKFNETIGILSRCLMETLIKLRWLILKKDKNSFNRYLRDSLDSDYEL